MTDLELNAALEELSSGESDIPGLEESGKTIPYWGWFWRYVNFTRIPLAVAPNHFVGFCVNNKWGYPEWDVTGEDAEKIRALCVELVGNPTVPNFQALYDVIQSLVPEEWQDRDVVQRYMDNQEYDEDL